MPRFRSRFLFLWLAAVASVVFVLPYVLTLQGAVLESLSVPVPLVLVASVLQSAVLLAVAAFVGLRAADAVGLRTPLTDALLTRASVAATFRSLRPLSAVAVGAMAGGVIVILDVIVFQPLVPEFMLAAATAEVPRWAGFLASFYGGIGEEILTRLFLVSVLAWMLRGRAVWVAIVSAALLFGAGHLPGTAAISPLTPALVVRALVLNSIGGIAFGWLYWRRGLEAAMLAHFSADVVLHVIVGT